MIVWEYIRQINPEYIFIVTNQDINPGTEEANLYTKMTDYVTASLAKYLDSCRKVSMLYKAW